MVVVGSVVICCDRADDTVSILIVGYTEITYHMKSNYYNV